MGEIKECKICHSTKLYAMPNGYICLECGALYSKMPNGDYKVLEKPRDVNIKDVRKLAYLYDKFVKK